MGETAVPTVSQVSSWQLDTLDTQATTWKQQSTTLKTELDGMYSNVGNSVDYLVGKFGNGMRDKGLVVRDDGYKTVGALEAAGSAIAVGSPGMRFAQQTVKQTIATLTAEGYKWGEDGTVALSLSQTANALSDKDSSSATVKLAALQRQADLYTTTLKGALHAAAVAAQGVADGVSNAFSQLPQAAQGAKPGSLTDFGLATQQGGDDGKLVAGGKATDAQLQAISARLSAAGITPADVEAINAGQQVTLSEAQWNYLHSFYNTAGLNGLSSMTDRLTTIGDTTAAATVPNQLNTLANPNVHSAGTEKVMGIPFHPQGGMDQLPSDVRNALNKDYEVHQGKPSKNLGAGDLVQVTHLMEKADARSAPGSDINKALLVQAGKLSAQFQPSDFVNADVDSRNGSAESLLQEMVSVGGNDKIAVHDILTGAGLPEGTSNEKLLDGLMHHHWVDDGKQVNKMLSWIGTDATNPDIHIAERAGQAATPLAAYVGSHGSSLLNLDGAKTHSLGDVNPEIVKGLNTALNPYIPELVGVPDKYLDTKGFISPDGITATEMDKSNLPNAQKIFAVMDTNTEAATDFNSKALLAADQLDRLWVHSVLTDPAHVDGALATRSGNLFGLVDKGLDLEITARKDADIGDAIHGFSEKGSAYDSFKTAVGTGVKYIPIAKDILGPMIDASNGYSKANIIGYSYETPHAPSKPFEAVDYTSARQFYQVAQALQGQDGTLAHDPQYSSLFDSDGHLKSYEDSARSAGDQKELHSWLQNILNSYRGGALRDSLQDMATNVQVGRSDIK
ncbi:hypothetical protein [Nocardia sp. NPDC056100]|uniref:TPR repeat region-containing protein n=1 Tax=Nocardia sp. NPDC056100 TaxID=3345712 RepID=UPI0035E38FCF